MIIAITYAVIAFISIIFFGKKEFKYLQESYPNLAQRDREADLGWALLSGFIKGIIFPISLLGELLKILIGM